MEGVIMATKMQVIALLKSLQTPEEGKSIDIDAVVAEALDYLEDDETADEDEETQAEDEIVDDDVDDATDDDEAGAEDETKDNQPEQELNSLQMIAKLSAIVVDATDDIIADILGKSEAIGTSKQALEALKFNVGQMSWKELRAKQTEVMDTFRQMFRLSPVAQTTDAEADKSEFGTINLANFRTL
jgi:hypothetical protein